MEMDYILLDGVSSDAKNVLTLDVDLPDFSRSHDEESIPGQLIAIESAYWNMDPADIAITMAVVGSSIADVTAKYLAARRWLLTGTVLAFSDLAGYHFRGYISKVTKSEGTENWMKFTATFRANPQCPLHVLSSLSGFMPAAGTPVPEQITAQNATCTGAFTAPGFMPSVAYAGSHDGEMYLAVTGTWTTLSIGGATGLIITWERTEATTVYIDCSLQEIYYLDSSVKVPLFGVTSGSFPQIDAPLALAIGGTGINVAVKMLVVERG